MPQLVWVGNKAIRHNKEMFLQPFCILMSVRTSLCGTSGPYKWTGQKGSLQHKDRKTRRRVPGATYSTQRNRQQNASTSHGSWWHRFARPYVKGFA